MRRCITLPLLLAGLCTLFTATAPSPSQALTQRAAAAGKAPKAEPARPAASQAVQRHLTEGHQLQAVGKHAAALAVADRALSVATAAGDAPGKALAHWLRTLCLYKLE